MIDYEQLAQEDALFPWLASDCMADDAYYEETARLDVLSIADAIRDGEEWGWQS